MERSECKKRKNLVICNDDDVENEEEKMEKFFALIRSFREARNCLMISGSSSDDPKTKVFKEIAAAGGEEQRKKRRIEEADPEKPPQLLSAWKPKFQHEDFMAAGLQLGIPPHHHPAVQANEIPEKGKNVKESIDLNLSL